MTRPIGEIRLAVLRAAGELAVQRAQAPVQGPTWRDVAGTLVPRGVSQAAVRHTWKNLVRAGALQPVGRVKVPGVSVRLQACIPASGPAAQRCVAQAAEPFSALSAASHGWASNR